MPRREQLRYALKRSVESDGRLNVNRFAQGMATHQAEPTSGAMVGARDAQYRPIDLTEKLPGANECEDYLIAPAEEIIIPQPELVGLNRTEKIEILLQRYQDMWSSYTTTLTEDQSVTLEAVPNRVWKIFITAVELNQTIHPENVQVRPYLINTRKHEIGMIVTEYEAGENVRSKSSSTFINESRKLIWQGRMEPDEYLLKHLILEQWSTQAVLLKRILDRGSDLQDGKFILREPDTLRQFSTLRQLGIKYLILDGNITYSLWSTLLRNYHARMLNELDTVEQKQIGVPSTLTTRDLEDYLVLPLEQLS